MKVLNTFFFFLSFILLLNCNKVDSNSCMSPNQFIVESGNSGQIYVLSSNDYDYIEIEYGITGYQKGNGSKTNNNPVSNLAEGIYDIYMRGNCGGSEWSDWSEVKSINIQGSSSTCFPPSDLDAYGWECRMNFSWYDSPNSFNSNYFEIEYGLTGFELGTGTTATTNNDHFDEAILTENMTYDFYVRANCGGTDFSNYADVFSIYADKNYNRCLQPKNVSAFRSGSLINYEFESDGDCEFEYTLIKSWETVGDAPIYSTDSQSYSSSFSGISSSSTYHFMVRTVCLNGNKTAWKTIVVN